MFKLIGVIEKLIDNWIVIILYIKICINNKKKWREEEIVKEKVFKLSLFILVMLMLEKSVKWKDYIFLINI